MSNIKHMVGQFVILKMKGVEFEVEIQYKENGMYIGVVYSDMCEDSPIQFDDDIEFTDGDVIS